MTMEEWMILAVTAVLIVWRICADAEALRQGRRMAREMRELIKMLNEQSPAAPRESEKYTVQSRDGEEDLILAAKKDDARWGTILENIDNFMTARPQKKVE